MKRQNPDEYPILTDNARRIIRELNAKAPDVEYYTPPPRGTDSITLKPTPHTSQDRTNYHRK